MSKVVFLDVDGTLLDQYQRLPDSTRRALTAAQAAGNSLILCTGRSKHEIYPWLLSVGFIGFIGGNGAYAEVDGHVVQDERLSHPEIVEISSWLDDLGAGWLWQSPESLNPSQNFLERFVGRSADGGIQGDWSSFAEQIAPYVREGIPTTASKVTFTLPHSCGVTLDDAREHFLNRYTIVDGSIVNPDGLTGELSALGMSKAIGLTKVADFLKVSVHDTVAVGDSANDVEMLSVAGIGVAMGNATPAARAAADWSTTSIDEDGIYNAFRKLKLIP